MGRRWWEVRLVWGLTTGNQRGARPGLSKERREKTVISVWRVCVYIFSLNVVRLSLVVFFSFDFMWGKNTLSYVLSFIVTSNKMNLSRHQAIKSSNCAELNCVPEFGSPTPVTGCFSGYRRPLNLVLYYSSCNCSVRELCVWPVGVKQWSLGETCWVSTGCHSRTHARTFGRFGFLNKLLVFIQQDTFLTWRWERPPSCT